MPRPAPAVELAIEAQVAIRELRSASHPLWESALATGGAAAEPRSIVAISHASRMLAEAKSLDADTDWHCSVCGAVPRVEPEPMLTGMAQGNCPTCRERRLFRKAA